MPAGYELSVSGSASEGFVLTNAHVPEDPEDPEEPGGPDNPGDPEEPDTPAGSEDPVIPETGDASCVGVLLASGGGIAALVVGTALRRRSA